MSPFLFLLAILPISEGLRVSGQNFYHGGTKVFLSGMNLAWRHYGNDFGNNRYITYSRSSLLSYLNSVRSSGGNSVRLFLHAKGEHTPIFDSVGYVTTSDNSDTLRSDLASFLDAAKARNIMVFITLWDGAVRPTQQVIHLIWDQSKLQTYIDRVLIPLVTHLQSKPALGGWDIINEPEGLIYSNKADIIPCFDTRPLVNSGANWVRTWIPMKKMLSFINHQIAAIKGVNSSMLTTVGTWSEKSCTDSCGYRNYYKDSCLVSAGGQAAGKVDFYQIHTYATNTGNTFNSYSPLKRSKSVFGLNKPVVIGEFSEDGGDGGSLKSYINHAYSRGYSGAWTWQANGSGHRSDSIAMQRDALRELRGKNNQAQGGLVNFSVCMNTLPLDDRVRVPPRRGYVGPVGRVGRVPSRGEP